MRGGSRDSGYGDDEFDDVPADDEPREPARRQSPTQRSSRSAGQMGQERTVSYQSEERYWTDYVRVALPVLGLLIMLGLFWYWASAVIGDDGDAPEPTATAVTAVITAEPPTPTATVPIVITPQQVVTPTTESIPTVAPTRDTSGGDDDGGDGFQIGDVVVVISDDVNMRSGPSTEESIVDQLGEGTELNVIGETVEGGEYLWIEVQDPATGLQGYVASVFLQKQ